MNQAKNTCRFCAEFAAAKSEVKYTTCEYSLILHKTNLEQEGKTFFLKKCLVLAFLTKCIPNSFVSQEQDL